MMLKGQENVTLQDQSEFKVEINGNESSIKRESSWSKVSKKIKLCLVLEENAWTV